MKKKEFLNKKDKKIVIAFFIIVVLLLIINGYFKMSFESIGDECVVDSDCVPQECCNSVQCVGVENAPDCDDVACTLECQEETLDCGYGSCKCIRGRCDAVIK